MAQLRVALWLAVSSEAQAKEDKISLQEQEKVGRAWVASNSHKLVKVFLWDGYSRAETDVLTAYEDFAAQGRFEYHELRKMWQDKAFDVLWVYVHDRIARSAALYAQVVGNVIRSGARILSHTDGWIDASNVDAFMAIGGFSTANDIRKLVERRQMGMRNRLKQGKSTGSIVAFTHVKVRHPVTGKDVGLAVNEAKRRLFDDAATLVLEGASWFEIDFELYQRFGHVTKTGKPFAPGRMYHMMTSPMTWGHNASRFRTAKQWASFGSWMLEPGHPIPPHVQIEYNVIPPVYTGELAERLKTEIKFRFQVEQGRTPSKDKFWFTGLVVCDECGYYLTTYAARSRKPRLKCGTHWHQTFVRGDCSQRKSVMGEYLKAWFNARLIELLESGSFTFDNLNGADKRGENTEGLRNEVAQLEKEIRAMIRKQSLADEDLEDLYAAEINEANNLLRIRKERLSVLEREAYTQERSHNEQQRTIDMIHKVGLEGFWAQEPPVIRNAFLTLLAGQRISASEGEIRRIVPAPSKNGQ